MLIATGVLSSAASTGSLTSISSHLAVTIWPPALILLVSLTNLPSFSVEQTVTSSDYHAPTAIGSGVTGSPAVISSAETLLAGQNANLPSTTDPEPLIELDSTHFIVQFYHQTSIRPSSANCGWAAAARNVACDCPHCSRHRRIQERTRGTVQGTSRFLDVR